MNGSITEWESQNTESSGEKCTLSLPYPFLTLIALSLDDVQTRSSPSWI